MTIALAATTQPAPTTSPTAASLTATGSSSTWRASRFGVEQAVVATGSPQRLLVGAGRAADA